MKLTGENRSTGKKTCPSVTLFFTNPKWTDPGSNPGLGGERPATNRLSHGMAQAISKSVRQEIPVPLLDPSTHYRVFKIPILFCVTKVVNIKFTAINTCTYCSVLLAQGFYATRRLL